MGWQDRDWAKLGDDELDALYGTGVPSRRFSVRQVVWSAVALLVVAGGAFAVTHRETGQPPAPLQLTPAPTVIYGEPIMFEGTVAARTEFTQQPTGAMQCTTIDPNLNHVRIARAAPYNGPCAHLMAEQATARWVCVSAP